MKKKLLIILFILTASVCSAFAFAACFDDGKEPNNNVSAPVAGHYELRDIPFMYNNLIITKYDYDFYLDGRVIATEYAATGNYANVFKHYGNYVWYEGTDLIYISWNGSSDIIDLKYTEEYVTNGIFKAYFAGSNTDGEVAGKMVSAGYSIKTELMYELNKTVGGKVLNGSTVQYVKKGCDALTVTAVANDGFEFVGWSDGVKQAERTDKNLNSNLSVTANFKQFKDIYKLKFTATQGGTLTGETYQEVVDGKRASSIIAVPDEGNDEYGYEFIGWSDGVIEPERSDLPKNNLSVEARFVRVGTAENPYKISTLEDLRNMEKHPKAFYVLSEDIILDGSINFKPLFSEENPFLGTFDGNGYSIVNLNIYEKDSEYAGLFAYIGYEYFLGDEWTGKVHNLNLKNVKISGNGYVGGIVGFSKGIVENCEASGELRALENGSFVGGIAGSLIDTKNCRVNVRISNERSEGGLRIGGVAGIATGNCSDCFANVNIDISASSAYVGGVFGYVRGVFINLSSSGNITVTGLTADSSVGGLIGEINGLFVSNYYTVLEDCYSSCSVCVTGSNQKDYTSSCGGLVGYMESSSGYSIENVKNCYATGNLDVSGGKVYVGGLIGYSKSDMERCYSSGNINVSGTTVCAGGLVGIFNQSIDVIACYSIGSININATNTVYAGGITGYHLGGEISNCYTISEIKFSGNPETLYAGGITGHTRSSITYNKTYWLYFSDSLIENAVGEIYSSGVHKVEVTKCTSLGEFKNIAGVLNDGLDDTVWEDSETLPKFKD